MSYASHKPPTISFPDGNYMVTMAQSLGLSADSNCRGMPPIQ